MRRSKATELGLKPLARFVGMAVVGVEPSVMGIGAFGGVHAAACASCSPAAPPPCACSGVRAAGPAVAIPKVLEQTGLTKDEIDIFELNEAFASQAAYCIKVLGLNPDRVNPLGGGSRGDRGPERGRADL